MEKRSRKWWVWAGGIGAVVAALCCATPILVVLLGVLGLGALTGYLDYVLLLVLVLFLGMLVYGLAGQRVGIEHQCCTEEHRTPSAPNDRGRGA